MAFGLQHEDEMEDWLEPGHLALYKHGGGHHLLQTTRLCKMLYLELLENGFTEEKLAKLIHDRAAAHGIGEENAFDQVVLDLCREHGVQLSARTLHFSRKGYAER